MKMRLNGMVGLLVGTGVLAAGVGSGLSGCTQYGTYPEIPTSRGTSESPNNPNYEAVATASLQYVATRFSPGGPVFGDAKEVGRLTVDYPMVINLPVGTRKSFYQRIASRVGPNVVPMTPENLALTQDGQVPILSVGRTWLRGNKAIVDVYRPVRELDKRPDGSLTYQRITVRLEGGLTPWRVVHARAWYPGDDAPPAPYYLPDIERIDQYEYSTRGMATISAQEPTEAEFAAPATMSAPSGTYAYPTGGESLEKPVEVAGDQSEGGSPKGE